MLLYSFEYLSNNAAYLSKNLSPDIIRQISTKINSVFVEAGGTIFKRNAEAKKLYIVYNGKAGFYSNHQLQKELNYNSILGEQVLTTATKYPFTAKAITDCELLMLQIEDYKNIITNQGVVVMQKTKALLESCPRLSHWDLNKIERL